MKVHSQMFPGGRHVVVFRERKSDSNVLAAKSTMEKNLAQIVKHHLFPKR